MVSRPKTTGVQRPPVGINPNVPIEVQRELRKVSQVAFDAQDNANAALDGLATKVTKNQADLLEVSKFVSAQVQAGGVAPINLTGLPGSPVVVAGTGGLNVTYKSNTITVSLPPLGPGAGTYTVGAKITTGGNTGQITLDAYGRVTNVRQAS